VFNMSQRIDGIKLGDNRSIAQSLTCVENELAGSEELLMQLVPNPNTKVVGITGPPGAGKSSLLNALLKLLVSQQKRVAILSIDPSSPFNFGALLGDRVRMADFYLHPSVFIRSVASRGSLGGLNAKVIEMVDVLKASVFDYVFIETVGVGQSEVEIAGIADTTIVVMVPEAGDEIQVLKAGIMEIADIFVVNKSDRSTADQFAQNLIYLAHAKMNEWEIPVIKSIATQDVGITELIEKIEAHQQLIQQFSERKIHLLVEKTFQLIQQKKMKNVLKQDLFLRISNQVKENCFNMYQFVQTYI